MGLVFEGLGELYFTRFGRLRPGKDDPLRDSMDEDNIRQFSDWMKYQALDDAIVTIECLKNYVEDVAGMDCKQYTKHLSSDSCGSCDSCRARKVLAGLRGRLT
jgi:hypothetical protein